MFGGYMLIEVCDANPAAMRELFRLEEEFDGLSVIENSCMSECDLCATRPYVFLDGELVTAETPDELFTRVRRNLAQMLDDDSST